MSLGGRAVLDLGAGFGGFGVEAPFLPLPFFAELQYRQTKIHPRLRSSKPTALNHARKHVHDDAIPQTLATGFSAAAVGHFCQDYCFGA